MNGSVITGWLARLIGIGASAATPFAVKYLGEGGAALVQVAAGIILLKSSSYIVPKAEHYIPKALQR